jgi:hypothetical protein
MSATQTLPNARTPVTAAYKLPSRQIAMKHNKHSTFAIFHTSTSSSTVVAPQLHSRQLSVEGIGLADDPFCFTLPPAMAVALRGL